MTLLRNATFHSWGMLVSGRDARLDLKDYRGVLPAFSEINTIPVIALSTICLPVWTEYLSQGGAVYHEKIELYGPLKQLPQLPAQILSIQEQYLQYQNYSLLIRRKGKGIAPFVFLRMR